jgi:glycosyltransferase involved in cell wall biosynthesis
MKVCYVCKAVDEGNPTVATQVRWIRALAAHPAVEHIHVLTRQHGRALLPYNVTIRQFGASNWPRTVLGFYREATRLPRRAADVFFVAQGGPYPALLLPIKLITRRPIYQWKAHPHISPRMRFYARYCDDLIFTPTPGSFPMDLDSVRVVGHGIDTELFAPGLDRSRRDLAAVGRVAAVKRLDLAIDALAVCRDRWALELTLDIFGPCASKDAAYRRQLGELIDARGLQDQVVFRGQVDHADLPEVLGQYRATINLSQTAFDKAAGESMAVGVPVITTNGCTAEMLPEDLRILLTVDLDHADEADGVAEAMREVMLWDDERQATIGRRLRETIVEGHSLDSLFDKIVTAIEADRAPSR